MSVHFPSGQFIFHLVTYINTFDHAGAVRLPLGAQPARVGPVGVVDAGHQASVERALLVELVVEQRLLPVVVLHLLQERRQPRVPGVVGGVLRPRQVLAAGAAAAAEVAGPRRRRAAAGAEEGGGGRGSVVRREAVSKDGRLQVAQEKCVVVQVVQGGVGHGQDAVTLTWRQMNTSM